MSNLWVSADGSWGCNEVKQFDTKNWKDKDWERLDGEPDSAKLAFAKYITRKRDKQAKKAKKVSEYSKIFDAQFPEVRTFILGNDGSISEEAGKCECGCGLPRVTNLSNPKNWGHYKP